MRNILLLLLVLVLPAAARAESVTVFAAASLTDAMRDIDRAWTAQGHAPLVMSFAASSTLARQMDAGATAGLFASADEQWMDWAEQRNLIAAGTRRPLLSNTLVLIVPQDQARQIDIHPGFDLAGLLGPNGRLATGDPAHVPVGIYAQQALTKLGLWNLAAPRIAGADSVRAALLLVERGEVPAGIVYATDAEPPAKVAIAGTFPADSHAPIVYPFAIPKSGDTPDARALLAFVASPAGLKIFAAHGFSAE